MGLTQDLIIKIYIDHCWIMEGEADVGGLSAAVGEKRVIVLTSSYAYGANSNISLFIISKSGKTKGAVHEFRTDTLEDFPIRRITFITSNDQRTLLLNSAKALYATEVIVSDAAMEWREWRSRWQTLWNWVDERLPQQEDRTPHTAREQSDAVHDLLAFLAEQMIELHEQKQTDTASFTDWLEQQTGSEIETWPLKTTVQSFWTEPWEEIERVLQRNRSKFVQTQGLRGKDADRALEPLVRAAHSQWHNATATLGPTLNAIAATDRLIDLLVYRLYGLTDAEIDLVEAG